MHYVNAIEEDAVCQFFLNIYPVTGKILERIFNLGYFFILSNPKLEIKWVQID